MNALKKDTPKKQSLDQIWLRQEFLPQHYAQDAQSYNAIIGIIDKLAWWQKMTLYYFYGEGLALEDIAQSFEIAFAQAETLLAKSIDALKRALAQQSLTVLPVSVVPPGEALVMTQIFQRHRATVLTPETYLQFYNALEELLTDLALDSPRLAQPQDAPHADASAQQK